MLFRPSPEDIIIEIQIEFCTLALQGEPYALEVMHDFSNNIGVGPNQISLKEALKIVQSPEKLKAVVKNYQEGLTKQGINISDYKQSPEDKEWLNNIVSILLLNHGNPVANKRTSLLLNAQVSALSFLAGSILAPFANILLGDPIDKFDHYWNPPQSKSRLEEKSITGTKPRIILISRDKFGGINSLQLPTSGSISDSLVKSVISDREKMPQQSHPHRVTRAPHHRAIRKCVR